MVDTFGGFLFDGLLGPIPGGAFKRTDQFRAAPRLVRSRAV